MSGQAKHTPGPWQRNSFTGDGALTGPLHQVFAETDTGPVGIARIERTPQADAMANARLIAAAPELLSICKEMLAAWEEPSSASVKARALAIKHMGELVDRLEGRS